ncbi:hypothetical protein [Natronospora cellulosivora (SeqCode)]
MKKSDKILLAVLFLILIGGGLYYYFNYYATETASVEPIEMREEALLEEEVDDLSSTSEEEADIEEDLDDEELDTSEELDAQEEAELEEEREEESPVVIVEEESAREILAKGADAFTYRRRFRNPFQEYRVSERDGDYASLTVDEVKEMVPFQLSGVIGNNQKRLAVINHNNEILIVENNTVIEDFLITSIVDDGININYRGINFKIEMGSGLSEIR